MRTTVGRVVGIALLVAVGMVTSAAGSAMAGSLEPESKRLSRAKDFIADEQWNRAVEELRAAASDPKETGKDEVLYWLAHSLNQAGDSASSLTTIRELERLHPSSLWVKPARALRLEIAVRLGRSDVLWLTAIPQPPRTPHAAPVPPAPPAPPRTAPPPRETPRPAELPAPPAVPSPAAVPTPPTPPAVSFWIPESYDPDVELRIQALRHLIHTDADKAIPMLKKIALEPGHPGSASRAVFVLAQSERPEARETVVQVARTGPPAVREAAVRELGRFGGPDVSVELLGLYSTGDFAVKRQVVNSFGERWERVPLLKIAQTEVNVDLQSRAIMMLGRAGGSSELRLLYAKARPNLKRPIILSLFSARADDALIHIAERERDQDLRQQVLTQLRLLGTPQAKAYLQKISQHR